MIKYFIISIVVSTLVPFILNVCLFKKTECDDENIIKPTRSFSFLGSVLTVICVFSLIMLCVQETNKSNIDRPNAVYFIATIPVIFIVLGVYFILYSANWRLYLGEEELEFTNIFGIKKTYKYSEIIEITTHYNKSKTYVEQYKICLKHRKIPVEMFLVNFDKFERVIKKRIKKNRAQ